MASFSQHKTNISTKISSYMYVVTIPSKALAGAHCDWLSRVLFSLNLKGGMTLNFAVQPPDTHGISRRAAHTRFGQYIFVVSPLGREFRYVLGPKPFRSSRSTFCGVVTVCASPPGSRSSFWRILLFAKETDKWSPLVAHSKAVYDKLVREQLTKLKSDAERDLPRTTSYAI